MKSVPDPRLAALTGLALAATVALWWLGSTRIALDQAGDASRAAAAALLALWVVRGMVLAPLGLRAGALSGWRAGAAAAALLLAPAWPLLILVWSASTVPLLPAALVELSLLSAGVVLPLLGQGLRRALGRPELAEVVATALGLALASTAWVLRDIWVWAQP
ncbi:MAG: hypothetical protein KA439_14015 [Rhizobacter sp.]|jgi:hypothetical protein|nr:hypothetical protein [Rhizobacter sp.]